MTLNSIPAQAEQKPSLPLKLRSYIYLMLAIISSISLLSIAMLLIPQAVKNHRYIRCIDVQLSMRVAINAKGLTPGKLNYLKAVEHYEGF